MIRVLFVCLGNICRSPMAEAVFRHQVQAAGFADRIAVDSAGTGDWHVGQAPHQGTRRQLDKVRIAHKGIQARQVTREDWTSFDYIIAMDGQNRKDMLRMMGKPAEEGATETRPQAIRTEEDGSPQVFLFMDFVPGAKSQDVPDPYYTGNFEYVYELIEQGCSRLLTHIQERLT